MSVIACIQARCGSSRLPGKVLLDLAGKPVLLRVIERVQRAKNIDEVIVLTTLEKQDMPIVQLCAQNGVRVYCGSEHDVLDRFYQAAKILQCDHIVRITADCPVIDSQLVSDIISRHLEAKVDYTSNVIVESWPDGEDIEVFTYSSLCKAWEEATLLSEREHVTPYIRNNQKIFPQLSIQNKIDLSTERWTLDTQSDYAFINSLFTLLASNNEYFGIDDILRTLNNNPELRELNSGIERNEGYKKSLLADSHK